MASGLGPRLLITGGSGKLGRELVRMWPDSLHPTHQKLDVNNLPSVLSLIRKSEPKVIIHCAALTNVRQCELDRENAWQTNVVGTANLVKGIEEYAQNSMFIHISTACVFHGEKGDYVETDIPYPKNFYSYTKAEAESVVRFSSLKNWLIIRTNFVARVRWPYKKAFTDRYGTYLFTDDVAGAIELLMSKGLCGIVHVCGEEKISMFELAKIMTPDIKPMTLADYTGPPLTMDMSLRSNRIGAFKLTR